MAVLSKFKQKVCKLKNNKIMKWVSVLSVVSVVASLGCFFCFAEDTQTGGQIVSTALSNALNQMLSDFFSYAAIVLPIGLTVFGVIVGIGYAMKLFKKISK